MDPTFKLGLMVTLAICAIYAFSYIAAEVIEYFAKEEEI